MRKNCLLVALVIMFVFLLGCAPVENLLLPPDARQATIPPAQVVTVEVRRATVTPTRAPVDTPTPLPANVLQSLAVIDQALISIYENWSGSVVHIQVTKGSGFSQGVGTGSGWVWDKNGHIVTNNHVIEGASSIVVRFANAMEVEGTVVGTDPDSDLAVIMVDVPADALVPFQLADSDQVKVGQTAVAIGNPFGFEQTMTSGIVSAIGRVSTQESGYSIPNIIQTDTPINPGNSGGPLLDIYGRVIGVTTMIYSTTGEFSGIGFAVPVNAVKRVIPALIETGRYEHTYLGITGTSITPTLADLIDLPVEHGVLVSAVTAGGPAERAGIRGSTREVRIPNSQRTAPVGGDIILAIDGKQLTGMDQLITELEKYSVGDEVILTILRDNRQMDVSVELAARPTSSGEPVFGSP